MKEENVKVAFRALECDFRGAVFCKFDDGEDFYTIIINSNLSEEAQIRTFRHELAHITNNDFHNGLSVGEIERRTHAMFDE